jgi:lupus La protein
LSVDMSEAETPVKPVEAVPAEPAEPAVTAAADAPAAEPAAEPPVEPAAAKDTTETKEDASPSAAILKTTAKTDYSNVRNNRKFDPNSREVSSDPVVIRKQVRNHSFEPKAPLVTSGC